MNTWAEDVGEGKFTACAMKSGRLEHDGPLPPDYGLASVDWVAFQGSPRGGLAGTELIENWWEGTMCTLVTLPPVRLYMLLTWSSFPMRVVKDGPLFFWRGGMRNFSLRIHDLKIGQIALIWSLG